MSRRYVELFALTIMVSLVSAKGLNIYNNNQFEKTASVIHEQTSHDNCLIAEWFSSRVDCVGDNSELDFSRHTIEEMNI